MKPLQKNDTIKNVSTFISFARLKYVPHSIQLTVPNLPKNVSRFVRFRLETFAAEGKICLNGADCGPVSQRAKRRSFHRQQ